MDEIIWTEDGPDQYTWDAHEISVDIEADPHWRWTAYIELGPGTLKLEGSCGVDNAEDAKLEAIKRLDRAMRRVERDLRVVSSDLDEWIDVMSVR